MLVLGRVPTWGIPINYQPKLKKNTNDIPSHSPSKTSIWIHLKRVTWTVGTSGNQQQPLALPRWNPLKSLARRWCGGVFFQQLHCGCLKQRSFRPTDQQTSTQTCGKKNCKFSATMLSIQATWELQDEIASFLLSNCIKEPRIHGDGG